MARTRSKVAVRLNMFPIKHKMESAVGRPVTYKEMAENIGISDSHFANLRNGQTDGISFAILAKMVLMAEDYGVYISDVGNFFEVVIEPGD